MSNEFNLERAKAGEPVEFRSAATSTWEPVYFVGLSNSDAPVIEMHGRADVFKVSAGLLRMAPKKVKMQYRIYLWRDVDGTIRPGIADPKRLQIAHPEIGKDFVEWIHADWQETEITE